MAYATPQLHAGRDASTTLAANITTTSALSFTLATSTAFASTWFSVQIDQEEILVESRSGVTCTVASGGRGFNDTTAATHTLGATVEMRDTSVAHERLVEFAQQHTHTTGDDGAQLDHTTLSNIGTNAHAVLDVGIATAAAHIAATAAHGATGAVVGTTNSQTLTNKTLTTPTIADFTNAGHGHANAAGAGTVAHTALTSIGTNTHAAIDTHIAASAAVHGLPANANVLGNKDAAGEYIRRGGTGLSFTAPVAASYSAAAAGSPTTWAVAYTTLRSVVFAGNNTTGNNCVGGAMTGAGASGFTPIVLAVAGSSVAGTFYYIAVGTD